MPSPLQRSAALCALLVATVLSARPVAAQSVSPLPTAAPVAGLVLDARTAEPVAGAVVQAEGTPLGTSTDVDGRFSLSVPASASALSVRAPGYAAQRVALTGRPLDVRLDPATTDLQPVVVTAGRGALARADAPLAVAALSGADLRETRPNGLAEALSRVPGVVMVDLGNEQHALAIRQPFSLKPLFLYLEDGIPIRPAGLFNHNALIEVNMADLEAVEVVRGPGSALYGAGAVGGSLNFVTARPSPAPAAEATVRRSATGYTRADGRASATFGRVGLAAGGYAARQRAGVRDHSDGDKLSVSLRAEARLDARTRLAATATASALDTDTDGALDSLNFFGGGTTSLQTFSYRRVEAGRAAVRLDRTWGTRALSTVTLFGRINRVAQNPFYRLRPAGPGAATGEVNAQRFRSLGLTVQHEAFPGWRGARLVAGATLDVSPSHYTARFGTAARDAQGRYVDFVATDSLLTDYAVRLGNAGAFVQGEVEAVKGVRLVASVRADRIRYALDNALAPGAFSGAADRTDTFARVTPRVGVVVALRPGAGLYANASQGFVPPEAGELYRGVQVPTLRPAVFASAEAGGFASVLAGRLAADVAVYRMGGRDEIVSVRTAQGTTDRNAGRTRHEGVEVSLLAQPVPAVSARLGAALARHTYVAFTVDERAGQVRTFDGRRMEKAPAFVANGEVVVRPVRALRLAAEVQRVSGYWMDPENTRRYGGHTVVNLRSGLTLRGVDVWASLLNATGARYATTAEVSFGRPQYTPGLPRALTLGVGARLGR